MSMTGQPNDLFERPAAYWLRRAQRCRQNGNLLRAAVLERHALRADPENDEACMRYVLTLRQLGCYEASNREACAALARNPDRMDLYGLMGQNLLAVGLRAAGQDALNIYLSQPMSDDLPLWHDDAYELACDCEQLPARKRKARFDGLLRIAAQRLHKGDTAGAQRALTRAGQQSYGVPSAQRELLWALLHHRQGDAAQCAARLESAVFIRPDSAMVLSSAAGLFHELGMKAHARAMLLRAAAVASVPASRLSVLLACDELGALPVALSMLRRQVRHQPFRVPALHDLCVCLLKLGRLEDAMPHIHRSREIDPDDAACELLFSRMQQLQDASVRDVRKAARHFSWYGAPAVQDVQKMIAPVTEFASQGPDALGGAICSDMRLRTRFLQLTAIPADWTAGLLAMSTLTMPEEERIRLMRDVLLQTPRACDATRMAALMLHQLQVPPPYAAMQDGRILWVDPTRRQSASPHFTQRLLTLRISRACRYCPDQPALALWCMQQVHLMTPAQRRGVIADPQRVWSLAFAVRFSALCGLPPVSISAEHLSRARLAALGAALRRLRALSSI